MNSKDSIEMKEIKVSKGKALLKFLGRHIVACYLFFVIAVLFYGCVAKAEGTYDYLSQIESAYFSSISSSNVTAIENLIDQYNMKYFFIGREGGTAGDYYGSCGQAILVFSDQQGIYIPAYLRCSSSPSYSGIRDTYYNDTSTLYFAFNYNQYSVDVWQNYTSSPFTGTAHFIAIWQDWNGNPWARYFTYDYNNGVASNYQSYPVGSITYGNYYANAITVNNYVSFGDYYAFSPVTSGGQCYLCHSAYEMTPAYSEDSRLKFALINDTYEGEVLLTDIREFVADFPIQDTSHSSAYLNPESITLKYTVDGTEKTITLDSNNSTIRSKYIFETPIYQFDFDDDNTSVVITSADFTIAGTSQSAPFEASETYRIATDYPIRRLSPLPIPSPIPDPTYNDVTTDVSDPGTVLQEITTQLTNDSTTTNAFTGEWTLDQEHPTVPSWADSYDFRVIKSDFNSIISGVVNKDVWNYYTSNDPNDYDWITGGFNPRNFVDENRNFAFYDMIIISVYEANIAWDPDAVGTNLIYQNIHLLGYIILYSQRYYVHKSAIIDSNILATLEYSSMNDVAFYETIKATLDQFEEYTLGRFDASLSIEKDSLSWLKTIDNSIKAIEPFDDSSILDVLDNIYYAIIGWGGTDTSNIESKLDTLINHFIANNSQENTAYKRFVTWLRDVNGKPVQYVTTGYDFFTELFDYFPFTKDLDGAGGFANVFDMGKGFIDLSTGHSTGIPEHYQSLSYYFNSANDGSYNVSSLSGR